MEFFFGSWYGILSFIALWLIGMYISINITLGTAAGMIHYNLSQYPGGTILFVIGWILWPITIIFYILYLSI